MEQESIYDWLWLLLVFGAGSRKIWKLLEQYETPQKVRQVLQTETDLPFIHEREQRSIRSITNEQIGKLIQNCAEKRIELVAYDDENYPESLRQIYNPPVVLFYQGQLSVLSDYPALTVVGTRKPSSYSICTADLLCRCLAKSGMLLVSGFAVGLDSVAHRAALLSGGKTVAVMGCGLDVPYPKRFRKEIYHAKWLAVIRISARNRTIPAEFSDAESDFSGCQWRNIGDSSTYRQRSVDYCGTGNGTGQACFLFTASGHI